MNTIPQALMLASGKASYELPSLTPPSSVGYTNSSPTVSSGTYAFYLDICKTNAKQLIFGVKYNGSVGENEVCVFSMPSGWNRAKFNYSIGTVTGASGLTLAGNSSGSLSAGTDLQWNGSFSSSSLSKSFSVTIRLTRIESPTAFKDFNFSFSFFKGVYVDPQPAESPTGFLGDMWINVLGRQASQSVTFNANRTWTAQATWTDTGTSLSTTSTWLNPSYNPSNYEARLGSTGPWTSLPGTVSWASEPAQAGASPISGTRYINIRNKTTLVESTLSLYMTINGPNCNALVYPTLTFPTNANDNTTWSWSFSFQSNGSYTTTYSTPNAQSGNYTSTGRWLRDGYSASNYRFETLSFSASANAGTGFTGSASGVGNISTSGTSFSASGNSGSRTTLGRYGAASFSVRIVNVTSGLTAAQPGVLLTVDKTTL